MWCYLYFIYFFLTESLPRHTTYMMPPDGGGVVREGSNSNLYRGIILVKASFLKNDKIKENSKYLI